MQGIMARNVNDALREGLILLRNFGIKRECRPNSAGGTVLEVPVPVFTYYGRPRERVLWHSLRDANPFFHFFEALWILAGRDDVAFLTRFNKRMADFSDNGTTFHAPYGFRMRRFHDLDQVAAVCNLLRRDPSSRQAVLQIWDAPTDLMAETKDKPCNDMVFCKVRDGALHITVCCRSNDVIWGAYGANVVQFSMLQEYMAEHIGVRVGTYTQVSDSYHVYEDNPYWKQYLASLDNLQNSLWARGDPYLWTDVQGVQPYPLFEGVSLFDADLATFFAGFDAGDMPITSSYRSVGFREVVLPLFYAHTLYRARDFDGALRALSRCAATDWRAACGAWIMRRAQVAAGRQGAA